MQVSSAVLLLAVAACGGGGGLHADAAAVDAATDAPPPIVEPIHLYGRWDTTSAASWPGSSIAARFSGTDLQAMFSDSNDDWLEITIDGVTQAPLHLAQGAHAVTIATGLAGGEHEVVLAKRTESYVGVMRFNGFVGATIIPTVRNPRLIEFVGDSITAGYGDLGTNPCSFTDATEAETYAWGADAAKDLQAAHVAVAYSGIGMLRNGGGATTEQMPVRYRRTLADDASSTWDFHRIPNIVVIGLGTNDFGTGDPGQAYEDAYATFITGEVRLHAPGVPVLLATSPMMSGLARVQLRAHLDAIVARLADPKVSVVEIAEQSSVDGIGCDYHPNVTTQRRMADALVPAIRTATGW